MSGALYMLRMRLDSRHLLRIGERRPLSHQPLDLGYLVHCTLRELFGDSAPAPFAVMGTQGSWLEVLGYSTQPAEALVDHARTRAPAGIRVVLDLDSLASKRMPDSFPEGTRLTFRVRACPVLRKSRGSTRFGPGAELDVFLAEVEKAGEETPLDRQQIYAKWLSKVITRSSGAQCEATHLVAMRRVRLVRRGDERKAAVIERPDVVFEGQIQVVNPEAFQDLLRRGIGRHRAFGFGMLLLRPGG